MIADTAMMTTASWPTSTALVWTTGRRRHQAVSAALFLVTVSSWGYLVLLSIRMGDMRSPLAMPMTSAWTRSDAALMWSMWAVMMAAMMLPSVAPMVNAYSRVTTSDVSAGDGSPSVFIAGYVAVWSGFAAVATAVQWVLHDATLVTSTGVSNSSWLGGGILLAAGTYQFTGLKDACLNQCRSPFGFLATEWRDGRFGALVMGVRHGAFCVGCCWAVMALLFVLGVMNLWWIAVVAGVVLIEKVIPSALLTQLLGVTFVVWGLTLLMEVRI
jgi:predicted metal-binding membrane protein